MYLCKYLTNMSISGAHTMFQSGPPGPALNLPRRSRTHLPFLLRSVLFHCHLPLSDPTHHRRRLSNLR